MPGTEVPTSAAAGEARPDSAAEEQISKKAAQKAAKKAERMARLAESAEQAKNVETEVDPLATNYGDVKVPPRELLGQPHTKVKELVPELAGKKVLVRARAASTRGKGKIVFLVLRQSACTVQCVASVEENVVSKQMLKYISGLNKESIVDVEGIVSVPNMEISSTSQKVELQMRKVYCISRAEPVLPLNVEDAARSEQEIAEGEQKGVQYVRVLQETRLNNRALDLRTAANRAIFRVESEIASFFIDFLHAEGFVYIQTPKLSPGASEGGAEVFKLDYYGQVASLAQSPQLHKQIAICGDLERVFTIGPVFRAEKSFTHRHLCEFVGLDLEMEIVDHYFEVIDVVGKLFVNMFKWLNKNCKEELEAINRQYPFQPLEFLDDTLKLKFEEGIAMLKEAGVEVDPLGDLNTEAERRLGQLVKDKYKTDFYVLHRYPSAVRPFYTMPAEDDERYSNSFDVFIRGEEIISGAQRVHDVSLLLRRVRECNIDPSTLSSYIDSFRWGAPLHGGAGVGLERVVMLFCGLNNVRKTSMFPRDPQRLTP